MSSDIKMSQANAFEVNKEFRPIYSSGSQPRGPDPWGPSANIQGDLKI